MYSVSGFSMCHKQHLHASSCMTHVGARIERGERGKGGGGVRMHACDVWEHVAAVGCILK